MTGTWALPRHHTKGFTIVELLIVIVVIAILAAIVIVAYNGLQVRAARSLLLSDLNAAAKQLEEAKIKDSQYPASAGALKKSDKTSYYYAASGTGYCLSGTSSYAGVGTYHVTNSSFTPVQGLCPGQPAGGPAYAISANSSSTCVYVSTGLYCWGTNTTGVVGNNSTTLAPTPVAITNSGALSGLTITGLSTSAGLSVHQCAIANGAAYCWGGNSIGQLGNNSTTDSLVPVAVNTSGVLAGKTVTDITTGGHTCAVADGKAYCWGRGFLGALGNNSTADSLVPVAVDTTGVLAGKTVTQISAGDEYFTCAVADGKAYCWGSNITGRLGNNSTTSSYVPVPVYDTGVLAGKTVTKVALGRHHACAIADGRAYCWGGGSSPYGSLGDGSGTTSQIPVAVDTSTVLAGKTVTDISSGYRFSCAIADGKAYCWGWGEQGKLGNSSTGSSNVPVEVTATGVLAGKTVTSISAGGSHACAIADGASYCWGEGTYRALGNGGSANSSFPVTVSPLP